MLARPTLAPTPAPAALVALLELGAPVAAARDGGGGSEAVPRGDRAVSRQAAVGARRGRNEPGRACRSHRGPRNRRGGGLPHGGRRAPVAAGPGHCMPAAPAIARRRSPGRPSSVVRPGQADARPGGEPHSISTGCARRLRPRRARRLGRRSDPPRSRCATTCTDRVPRTDRCNSAPRTAVGARWKPPRVAGSTAGCDRVRGRRVPIALPRG